jgi:hypothetical protein
MASYLHVIRNEEKKTTVHALSKLQRYKFGSKLYCMEFFLHMWERILNSLQISSFGTSERKNRFQNSLNLHHSCRFWNLTVSKNIIVAVLLLESNMILR